MKHIEQAASIRIRKITEKAAGVKPIEPPANVLGLFNDDESLLEVLVALNALLKPSGIYLTHLDFGGGYGNIVASKGKLTAADKKIIKRMSEEG